LANLPTDIVFNPFEQYEEGSALLTDTDVDPDTNYFNTKTLCTSKYVCIEEINTALHPSNSQSFSILHLNCRSLFHKLTDIQLLLLQSNATVLAVTETWLNKTSADTIYIPGYVFVSKCRENEKGGGVGFFVKDTIAFEVIDTDWSSPKHGSYESMFIKNKAD